MADGADYPGYPEPDPKSKWVKRGEKVGIIFYKFAHSSFILGKVLIISTIGAMIGVYFTQASTGGTSSELVWIFVFLLAVVYVAYHKLQKMFEWYLEDTDRIRDGFPPR